MMRYFMRVTNSTETASFTKGDSVVVLCIGIWWRSADVWIAIRWYCRWTLDLNEQD